MKFLWFLIPDPDLVARCLRRLQSWSSLCQWWKVTEKTRWWRPRRISTAGMPLKTSAHGGDSGEDRASPTKNAATSFPTAISRKLVSSTSFLSLIYLPPFHFQLVHVFPLGGLHFSWSSQFSTLFSPWPSACLTAVSTAAKISTRTVVISQMQKFTETSRPRWGSQDIDVIYVLNIVHIST